MRVVTSGALFLTLALAPVARAQPTTSPPEVRAPGAKTHDGFYLRLQLGVAYTNMSSSSNGTDRSIAGGGTGFDIALGAALTPHVILYGTFVDSTARDPNGTLHGPSDGGMAHGMLNGAVDAGASGPAGVAAVGPGLAYYLDSNLFFAGSLLGSRLVVDTPTGSVQARSDWGFTFEGLFGKEWWVSNNWGLGVCGRMLLGAMKDRPFVSENVSTWNLAAFSVMFSATYN